MVNNSYAAINEGVYKIEEDTCKKRQGDSELLIENIKTNKHPVLITEIKFSSPSLGVIRKRGNDNDNSNGIKQRTKTDTSITDIANAMIDGGTSAISILTQPYLFNGSPKYFMIIRESTSVPLLMKDIIVDKIQIDAAQNMSADYILLIQSLVEQGYIKEINEFIEYAHKKKLKTLLEVHTKKELSQALETDTDIIGINNRNLDTLEIDLNTTCELLKGYKGSKPIISESGIKSPQDIRYLKESCGVNAFLVGSSIMEQANITQHVKELVNAY